MTAFLYKLAVFVYLCFFGIDVVLHEARRWREMATDAGFEDIPTISILWWLLPIYYTGFGFVFMLVLPTPENTTLGWIKDCVEFAFESICLTFAALAVLFYCLNDRCVEANVVPALINQTEAVAEFDRLICAGWAETTSEGLAISVQQGWDLNVTSPHVFRNAGFYAAPAVGEWCSQAIANGIYAMNASYDGVPPFAALCGKSGECLFSNSGNFSQIYVPLVAMVVLLFAHEPALITRAFNHRRRRSYNPIENV